jgi:hypothetical protein
MRHWWYILEGKIPRKATEEEWFEQAFKINPKNEVPNKNPAWIVAQEGIGETYVSTVFLGIDHQFSFSNGPPLLFETMVFGDIEELDCLSWRCSTWAEAEMQHRAACAIVRAAKRTA